MPKFLRILLPVVALALFALVPAASTAPGPTSDYNGGYFGDAPHSDNFEWISSTRAPAWWDNNRTQGRYVSDAVFKGNTYFLASYDHTAAYDISDPAHPEFLSSVRCPGSQGDVIIQGNLLFVAKEGGHNIPHADLNRACETAAANETQRVFLYGYSTNGDSFTLNYNGADTAAIVRGTNNTTAAVAAALQGASEVQTVALTSYDENGDSYTLTYGGVDTIPIVRGQNNTAAGIQNALQGGNEQQQVTLTNFNAANANNNFQVQIGGNNSAVLGNGGTAISNANVAAAINAISGFAGTVTVAGAGNGGFTVTFGGASANTDVPAISIVNLGCAPTCTATVRENAQGGTPISSWPTNGTVSVGSLADTGYTLTFGTLTTGGPGHQGTDVSDVTVTNGAGTTPPSGTVTETTKGTAGVLPVGSTATVASIGSAPVAPAFADAGVNVTFGGALAGQNVSLLSLTNKVGLDDDPEVDTDLVTSGIQETTVAAPSASFNGLVIFDISDPSAPKFLKAVPVCGGAHTITKYFDKKQNRVIVYMTRSATTGSLPAWGINCSGLPGGRLTAVAVPMDRPKAAHVASENVLTGFAGNGCHDVNVHEGARLITMACPNGPGLSMARLAEDGLSATLMWTFTWPGLATTHSAAISWDGKLAFVNGEPGGGSGAECGYDDDVVKPTMHILDAETGRLLGNWALPRPQNGPATLIENCTIHVLNMIPMIGRHLMATSFYNGGMAVTDFTNPRAPRELAYMDIPTPPAGTPVDLTSEGCWTGYWYNGNQYCTELSWGFHVWRMSDGAYDNALTMDVLNGQTHDAFIKCKVSYTGGPSKARTAGTVNASVQLYGPTHLQPGKGVKVRVAAPGFNKVLTTNASGQASTSVIASQAGKLNVSVPTQVNLPTGCSAPSKSIARRIVRR